MSTPFLRGQNLLANSRMSFWQRGNSLTAVTDNYLADRFSYSASPALQVDYTQSADVPTIQADYSLNIGRVNSISPAATEGGRVKQIIEGNFFRQIRGGKFTLFFWAKSSKVGPRYVSMRNSANNRYFLQRYEITQANTWQSFQFQLTHDASGTWVYDAGVGLDLSWQLQLGSSINGGIAGSWQTGSLFGASDQVNTFDANNSYFRLALPMVVPGHVVLDPLNLPINIRYDEEFRFCQRYYEQISRSGEIYAGGNGGVNTNTDFSISFKIEKRATPVMAWDGNGALWRVWGSSNAADYYYQLTTISFSSINTSKATMTAVSTNTMSTFIVANVLNAGGFIVADAEY